MTSIFVFILDVFEGPAGVYNGEKEKLTAGRSCNGDKETNCWIFAEKEIPEDQTRHYPLTKVFQGIAPEKYNYLV